VISMSAPWTTTMEEQKRLLAAMLERDTRERSKGMVGGAARRHRWADQIGPNAYAEDVRRG
jgi:methanogenic corrinoid protein MtbC1